MAKDDELGALNIRDFPKEIIRKCRIKAAQQRQTLKEFVEGLLREATSGMKDTKPAKKP